MAENKVQKSIQVIDIDAYSPPLIASRIDKVALVKAKLSFAQTFLLGILAGVYIAIGAQFATFVISDSTLHFGLNSLIAGIVFSLGLMLVVVGGAELFTGNCLIIMGYISKRITTYEMLNNWIVSFAGNLVGSLTMVCWMSQTHQWEFFHNMVGAKALLIANTKVNLSFSAALARGVLCNAMVCLAIWLCFSGRSVAPTQRLISLFRLPWQGASSATQWYALLSGYVSAAGAWRTKSFRLFSPSEVSLPVDLSTVSQTCTSFPWVWY